MDLLQQNVVCSLIRESGAAITPEKLKRYLIDNHHRIEGVSIVHHENVDKNGRENHWYEIRTSISQSSANKLVAEQYVKDAKAKAST